MASPIPFYGTGSEPVPHAFSFVALGLAHFFDYASFLVMIDRHGMAAEANPVVVVLADAVGLPGLTVAKVVTVAFAALLMTVIALAGGDWRWDCSCSASGQGCSAGSPTSRPSDPLPGDRGGAR